MQGDRNHTLHNAAIPGVRSEYVSSCLRWHLPAEVDVVLVGAYSLCALDQPPFRQLGCNSTPQLYCT